MDNLPNPISTSSRRARISVRQTDRIVVVAVAGELDGLLAPELEHKLRVAARLRPAALVLDLSAVDFVDLRAVRAISRLRRDLRRANAPLTVVTSAALDRLENLLAA